MTIGESDAVHLQRVIAAIEAAGGDVMQSEIQNTDLGGGDGLLGGLLSGGPSPTLVSLAVAIDDGETPPSAEATQIAVANALDDDRLDDPTLEGQPITPDGPACPFCPGTLEQVQDDADMYECPDCRGVATPETNTGGSD